MFSGTASDAHGVTFETLQRIFGEYGERLDGDLIIASKRKLLEALIAAKLAGGNEQGNAIVGEIFHDHCIPEHAAARHLDRCILTRDGSRNATVFVWRMGDAS